VEGEGRGAEFRPVMVQPFLISEGVWVEVKDGDASAREIFRRHYSYRPYKDGRNPALFVGPGEKMVLLTPNADALFVWRKFKSADGQEGVNCSVFRNESNQLASELIREAEKLAWERWPGSRLFTYVNGRKVKSRNPGLLLRSRRMEKVRSDQTQQASDSGKVG
jgi:hypothetical protein